MSRRAVGASAALVLVLSGLTMLSTSPASAAPPSPEALAVALDAPADVTVSAPAEPLSYAVVDQLVDPTVAFNDLPSKGDSYVVLSTGLAADAFSSTVPNDQPSTDLGAAGPDTTTLTLDVAPQSVMRCLLVDFSMATEERVHTYTAASPSDYLSVKLAGDATERARNRGGAYINETNVAADDVDYSVNAVNYWHSPGDSSDPLHGTIEQPRLPTGATPFDYFTTRDTAEVPISAAGGTVTVTVADANNGKLDSAVLVDSVRLTQACSFDVSADTGISTGKARIDGYRGVGNTLTLDPDRSTEDVVEKYDNPSNGWFAQPVELRFRWYRNTVPYTGNCYSTSLKSWIAIPDADRQSYVPTNVDKNYCLMARVTGVKDGYRSETFPQSASPDQWYVTLPIQDGAFTAEEPTVTGAFEVGGDVTVQVPAFTPRPDSHTIQWYAGTSQISGATGQVLRLTASEAGKIISVKVTAKRSGFADATKTSPQYGPVLLQEMTSADTPTISGTTAVGATLTALPGTWSPVPDKFTYQWKRDGEVIGSSITSTYTTKTTDVGRRISVEVTGAKSGYFPLTRTSDPVMIGEGGMGGLDPTIKGTPTVGEQLTASTTGWSPVGASFTYQWKVDGVAASKGTSRLFTIPGTAAGKKITVTVSGELAGYTTTSRTTAPTAAVAKGRITTTSPGISGRTKVGYTVSVRTLGWSPYDVRKTYRWMLDGKFYGGSTSRSTFKLPKSARGKRVSVRVTGTLTGYTTAVRTSPKTSRVSK